MNATALTLVRHSSRLGWQRSRIAIASSSSLSSSLDLLLLLSNNRTTENSSSCHLIPRRWSSTTSSPEDKEDNKINKEDYYDDDEDEDEGDSNDDGDSNSNLLYTSSMGGLISRLKIVSITSCFISVVGLPLFIFIKNGDFPTMQQVGLGSVAFMGATGSTLALHFVFGPYILELNRIPIPIQSTVAAAAAGGGDAAGGDNDEEDSSSSTSSPTPTPPEDVLLYQATTRSVFGWKKHHVFDPLTDVTKYAGMRPFANFVAKGVTLYAHPHLLPEDVRVQLLHPASATAGDEPQTKEEAAAAAVTNKKKEEPTKKKKDEEDDDGFIL
jgi:hypothetical protein